MKQHQRESLSSGKITERKCDGLLVCLAFLFLFAFQLVISKKNEKRRRSNRKRGTRISNRTNGGGGSEATELKQKVVVDGTIDVALVYFRIVFFRVHR